MWRLLTVCSHPGIYPGPGDTERLSDGIREKPREGPESNPGPFHWPAEKLLSHRRSPPAHGISAWVREAMFPGQLLFDAEEDQTEVAVLGRPVGVSGMGGVLQPLSWRSSLSALGVEEPGGGRMGIWWT